MRDLGIITKAGGKVIITLISVLGLFSVPLYAVPVTLMFEVETTTGNPESLWGHAPIFADIDWDAVYANPDKTYTWYMEEPRIIRANNNPEITLATILGINFSVKADPIIEMGFAVAAGDYETYFSFTSDVLNFAPMTNPDARAYASITPNQGDTVNGCYEYGTKAYSAIYNGSEVFGNFVDTPATWPISYEDSGWQQIQGTVSSIHSEWWFTLSANGLASGSSSFEVVPEPATIVLLGIGGLVLCSRRKRK